MNREKAIRLKFYEVLNGQLQYDSAVLPVNDAKLQDDSDIYIILTEQRATDNSSFHCYKWECEQDIEIHSVQQHSVSRDIVDDVAEQIETLIFQALKDGTETNGWQLNNLTLSGTRNAMWELTQTKNEVFKELTFRMSAVKLASY